MKNTESNKCPACGGELSGAVCPRCAASFLGGEPSAVQGEPATPFHPPSPAELAPLFPQLEILELVGKGGMGAVYKARQRELDRLVALKILPPGVGGTSSFSERFAREAKALAKLNHPGIVTLYEFGSTDGGDAGKLFFFLMEYVDGVNLRQMIRGGRMAAREALAIVPEICDALQFAHDHGIVHRDIKPENILIDRRGRVKVADFGLAKLVGDPAERNDPILAANEPALTQSGSTFGTPSYMSPEQLSTPGEVDHRADIYSLGVVIYEMLTGELPRGSFPAPSRKVAVDSRIDEIVLRTLERERDLRQQSADEVKTEMQGAVSGTAPQSAARKEQTLPQLRLVSKAALIGGIVLFIASAVFTYGSTQRFLLAIAATAFVLGGLGLLFGGVASSVLSPAAAAAVTVRSLWLFLGGTTALVAGLIVLDDAPYVPVHTSGHQMQSVLMPDPSVLKLGKLLIALGGVAAFVGWCGLWYALSQMKRGTISTKLRGFARTCAWLPVVLFAGSALLWIKRRDDAQQTEVEESRLREQVRLQKMLAEAGARNSPQPPNTPPIAQPPVRTGQLITRERIANGQRTMVKEFVTDTGEVFPSVEAADLAEKQRAANPALTPAVIQPPAPRISAPPLPPGSLKPATPVHVQVESKEPVGLIYKMNELANAKNRDEFRKFIPARYLPYLPGFRPPSDEDLMSAFAGKTIGVWNDLPNRTPYEPPRDRVALVLEPRFALAAGPTANLGPAEKHYIAEFERAEGNRDYYVVVFAWGNGGWGFSRLEILPYVTKTRVDFRPTEGDPKAMLSGFSSEEQVTQVFANGEAVVGRFDIRSAYSRTPDDAVKSANLIVERITANLQKAGSADAFKVVAPATAPEKPAFFSYPNISPVVRKPEQVEKAAATPVIAVPVLAPPQPTPIPVPREKQRGGASAVELTLTLNRLAAAENAAEFQEYMPTILGDAPAKWRMKEIGREIARAWTVEKWNEPATKTKPAENSVVVEFRNAEDPERFVTFGCIKDGAEWKFDYTGKATYQTSGKVSFRNGSEDEAFNILARIAKAERVRKLEGRPYEFEIIGSFENLPRKAREVAQAAVDGIALMLRNESKHTFYQIIAPPAEPKEPFFLSMPGVKQVYPPTPSAENLDKENRLR